MGMALRAVADDGNAPVLDDGQIGVFVIVDSQRILCSGLRLRACGPTLRPNGLIDRLFLKRHTINVLH
ncbi:MAG: hypothetical protein ACREX9_04795, partial [Gammaproteobacteria bacterium]